MRNVGRRATIVATAFVIREISVVGELRVVHVAIVVGVRPIHVTVVLDVHVTWAAVGRYPTRVAGGARVTRIVCARLAADLVRFIGACPVCVTTGFNGVPAAHVTGIVCVRAVDVTVGDLVDAHQLDALRRRRWAIFGRRRRRFAASPDDAPEHDADGGDDGAQGEEQHRHVDEVIVVGRVDGRERSLSTQQLVSTYVCGWGGGRWHCITVLEYTSPTAIKERLYQKTN